MPSISKIRFTNVIYENGLKRFNDDIFEFDGYNGVVLLENGGGKTVFIQAAIQSILPHSDIGDRKIRETLSLEGSPCHIAIEWILNERPRRYALTAVTLFLNNNKLDSYKYVYEYMYNDEHKIEDLPFVKVNADGRKRPSGKGEISEYYQYMTQQYMMARTFKTITDFHKYIEENYKIIPSEWRHIASINANEGGVEGFFEGCSTTRQLVDKLLIPVVEGAVSEKGTEDFVNTFERHREHFKKHKQLRERIDESKQIEVQINGYVDKYYIYHSSKEEFKKNKSYIKGLYLFAKDEEKNISSKLDEINLEKESIATKINELKKMEDSYNIAVLKRELDEVEEIFRSEKEKFDAFQNQYTEKEMKQINLSIAKIKSEINQVQDKIKTNEMTIEKLYKELSLEQVEEELQENSSKLRGYYLTEEENFEKEIKLLKGQKVSYTEQLKEKEIEKNNLIEHREELIADINKNIGQIENIEKELNSIRSKLPDSEEKDSLKDNKDKWSERISYLERKVVDYSKEINILQNERMQLNGRLKHERTELDTIKGQQSSVSERLSVVEDIHNNLLLKVKVINDGWNYINSLYIREDSIINYIESKIEGLINEKEDILLKERVSKRLLDDYGNNKYFTVEPLLEKWIGEWKNDFSSIEAGTRYIQRATEILKVSPDKYYDDYPYWPISLVVSDNEIDKVKKYIDKVRNKLTNPILILSDSEARYILENGKGTEEFIVFPVHWKENISEEKFSKWKRELIIKGEEITTLRKSKEAELNRLNVLLSEVKEFFRSYSYDEYQQLKADINDLEQKVYSKTMLIDKMDSRIGEIHNYISQLNMKKEEARDESNALNSWVKLAQEYLVKDKDKENLVVAKYKLIEQQKKRGKELIVLNSDISRIESICQDLSEEIITFNNRINSLRGEELYKEVSKVSPRFSQDSKNRLEAERKKLKELLYNQNGDINSLREQISRDEEYLSKLEKNLARERKKSYYPINEEITFPSYGDEEIEKLIEEINNLKALRKNIESSFNKAKDNFNGKKREYDVRKGDYLKSHSELIEFKISLYEVKMNIDNERQELTNRYNKNNEVDIILTNERNNIEETLSILTTKNERFNYLLEDIIVSELGDDIKRDFPYNRKEFILKGISILEELEKSLGKASEELEDEKRNFESFCNDCINDVRLKKRTIEGIRYKDNYNDVLEWQRKMKENLARIIKIAEDDIREHDRQLEHFIEHLSKYLLTLTEELRNITKNTRIKVEDKWKEIFKIDVPDWNENEGKQELRRHVDWMIKQLESSKFKNHDGNDNDGEIRKEIERWLDSKQLLGIVMKNQDIKVSCRKVTNDGKISSTPTTWEHSNKWSGGEKWSKNMTLFLGILRYLAEKRQNIITGNKTNRAVIVDNPFGKASSDHVLDPVFFIAEKLGFQVIALTAHVEGKFIRSYFPIVYSCKLREAANINSQIVDKEKEINYAFFKDNDPRVLHRIGEEEQMNLFN